VHHLLLIQSALDRYQLVCEACRDLPTRDFALESRNLI